MFRAIGRFLRDTDLYQLFLCLFASAFGVTIVYSATRHTLTETQVVSRETIVMACAIGLGIICCLIISAIDYELLLKLWPAVGGVALVLMLLLFAIGTGPKERPDVRTWIAIPFVDIYFQPSELLKVAFIITFSVHLELVGDRLDKIVNILLLCAHGAVPTLLVVVTGDMGSALVFMMIFVTMMFISGIKLRYFAVAGATVVAAAPIVWIKVFSSIQRDRFLALLYPESYPNIIYQQVQGRNAMGSGQLFGKGLFKGPYTQKGIVPEDQNDMVLSAVGEELGFVGCMVLMIVMLLIILKIIKTSRTANDTPGRLMCCGVAAMIASQVIVNVGMCLMFLPCIGITLPFMSAGGSSNLCIYLAMGLVLSVYRFNKEKAPTDFRVMSVRTPYI